MIRAPLTLQVRSWVQSAQGVSLIAGLALCGLVWGRWDGYAFTRDLCLWASLDARPRREAQVVFITVGDEDLARFPARDPTFLDRRVYARAVDRLTELRARSIVFDVLFDRKAGDSAQTDPVLAEAIRRSGRVFLARCFAMDPETGNVGMLEPLPVLRDACRSRGFVNVLADPDGVIRRVKLMMSHEGRLYNHIALEVVARERGQTGPVEADHALVVPGRTPGETLEIPVTGDGKSIVDYARVPGIERLSLSDLLDPEQGALARAMVEGKIALIGSTSPLLKDRHPYLRHPLTRSLVLEDGAWFIASFMENLVSKSFLKIAGIQGPIAPLVGLVLLAWALAKIPLVQGAMLCGLLAAGSWLGSFHLYSRGWLMDSVGPSLSLGILFGSQLISRVLTERRRFARLNRELSIEITRVREQLEEASRAGTPVDAGADVPGFLEKGFMNKFLPPHFQQLEFLGQGGMGVVYRGLDTRRNERVALKVLSPLVQDNATAVSRFLKEAQVMKKLEHPGLVAVHEIGKDVLSYFTMELVDGMPLDEVLQKEKALARNRALAISRQLGEVLGYIHGRGIVHRDIKPSNIMLLASDQIKLLDFGLARDEDMTSLTRTGDVLGTLRYMAPEQFAGRGTMPATDIYSMGLILCQMLTGVCPERQGNVHMSPRVALAEHDLPEPILDLLERMMSDMPDLRPENGDAVAREIRALEEGLTKR